MNAILRALRTHGITIRLDGTQLLLSPRESVSDALAATVRANKAQLIEVLRLEAFLAKESKAIDSDTSPERLRAWKARLVDYECLCDESDIADAA